MMNLKNESVISVIGGNNTHDFLKSQNAMRNAQRTA